MMWTTITVVLTLLGGMAAGLPEMPSVGDLIDAVGERPFRSLRDLNDYTNSLLDLANHHMARSFAAETRRYKRALDLTSIKVSGTAGYGTGYMFAMDDLSKFNSTNLLGVTKLTVHDGQNNAYWILTYDGQQRSHAVVQVDPALSLLKLVNIFQLPEVPVLGKCEAYIHNGVLWIVISSVDKDLVKTIRVDLLTSSLDIPQVLQVNGIVGGMHLFEDGGSLYLVMGIRSSAPGKAHEPSSSLYKLVGHHFDKQDEISFRCQNVTSITGFKNRGEYYLVFGTSNVDGTHVYKFNEALNTMYLSQILNEMEVASTAYFYEQQEGKHYVILNIGAEAVVYRWEGLGFLQWQTLETQNSVPAITSIQSFTFPSLETILMTARGDSVSFYTDDVYGYFKPSFVMQTHCHSIHNLLMKRLSNTYVIVYVCKEGVKSSLDSREVIMDEVNLEKPKDREDLLLECLVDLQADLDGRKPTISLLEQAIADEIVMTNDVSQTWQETQIFTAGLTIGGTTGILQTANVKGQGTTQPHEETFEEFYAKTDSLEDDVEAIGASLDGVLYHSTNQVLSGSVVASVITADKFESNSTRVTKLNDMPVLDMSSTFMIDGIEQNIRSSMYVHSMKTDLFSTREQGLSAPINDVLTNQFMRKSVASQEVTGNHHYRDFHVNHIHGKQGDGSPLVLNGIDTSKIVTKGNNFTFMDKKTFHSMTILQELDVQLLNEVDLSDLSSHLVYTNVYRPQILDGSFTLHDVNVDGNVDVKNINSVDMKELNTMVVRTSGDFTLSGDVTYQKDFHVSGNLISPILNGIVMDNIVDKDTTTINGVYTFTNANIKAAIGCSNISGINLSVDVVTVDADQTISGALTFTDDVLVTGPEGVKMLDSVTINNIDPYSLDKMDDHGNLFVEKAVVFNAPLHVTEDVDVEVINALALKGIEDRYWRKETDQVIDVLPEIVSTTFSDYVTAKNINNHQMADFLSVTGSQTINGAYTFQGLVTINGHLKVTDGKVIDGVDVSSLHDNLVTLSDNQDIEAETTFGKVIILGDLVLNGDLNGWNVVTDLVRLDQSLPQTGSLAFLDKATATSLQLSSADLTVQSLNGMDVKSATEDLVLVNEDASLAGPLKFTSNTKANDLFVSGTVDGVDVTDLVDRSLKKTSATPQAVTGAITVNKGVHFDQSPSLTMVNSKDWTTYLSKVVPQNYNGAIGGKKTFTKPVSISGNFNPTTLNGFSVVPLSDRILTKSTNQNVGSKYNINGNLAAKNVNAPEIDGVNTANLVLVDQARPISGLVSFADNLEVKDVTSDLGVLDGCDLLQLNGSTVWRSNGGNIELSFPITMESIDVGQDVAIKAGVKAGTQELMHFLNMLVSKSSNQNILGKVEFITDIKLTNLVASTADGVDIDNLYAVTVLDNKDNVINCDVAFTTNLNSQALTVEEVSGLSAQGILIDSLNVTEIDEKAVLIKGGSYLMTGDKTFTSGLTAGGLKVTRSLGGIPVQDLVVVSATGQLADELLFRAPITVKGDLEVDGLIDDVDLEQLLMDRIRLDTQETLTSSTSFEGLKVEGDLVVEEIDGVKLTDIVLKSGRIQQDVTGPKTFNGGFKVEGKIQATLLNNVDIPALNLNVVRKDRSAKIEHNLVFEMAVEANTAIDVTGEVNGYKLSDVNYPPSVLNQNIINQSTRLYNLNSTLSNTFIDTKALACGMYETLMYGELLNVEDVAITGKMSVGAFGGTAFVAVRECDVLCTCPSQYSFYHVSNNGDLLQDFNDTNSAFIFDTEGYEGTGVVNNCTGEAVVKTLQLTDSSHPVGNLGAIADVAVFTVNGVPYIVTASTIAEGSFGSSKIHVTKLTSTPVVIWSLQTSYSASTVDVTLSDNGWLLLVANHMASNDSVDPFTAPSQLYLWSTTEEKFNLIGEYIGQRVTSGIFLDAKGALKERYFSLAQLQASDSPVSEDNVKYTTDVMVFKYGLSGYQPYQRLPSYGVVAQESIYIGDDLYLLLLSEFTHTLDVYENSPTEGFRIYQKIPVCRNPLDVRKIVVSFKDLLLVSCKEPAQIMKIQFLTKGFTYRE